MMLNNFPVFYFLEVGRAEIEFRYVMIVHKDVEEEPLLTLPFRTIHSGEYWCVCVAGCLSLRNKNVRLSETGHSALEGQVVDNRMNYQRTPLAVFGVHH